MADSSLLLLADIVPTGVFGALQVLNHPKVLPVTTGKPWPHSYGTLETGTTNLDKDATLLPADRVLTFAILGLGPVGVVGVFCCSFFFGSLVNIFDSVVVSRCWTCFRHASFHSR